ncbi:MAG TPA: hypothetical protein VLH18_07890 [Candidatus Limnocylindrales bacterium]|nr:hypothetical protein [Candidatus Limnocylindrales bacterium]
MIRLPLFEEVDLQASTIMITTMLIGFLDGFNFCSFFVLTFLMAIIVHSVSRKKVFLVGITFLLVTPAVYGLFILGVLNVMIFAGRLLWVSSLVAVFSVVFGLFSIKDLFAIKENITFSIPAKQKSKFYSQVRKIFHTDSVTPMITATAVIALGVSLVELPCTADSHSSGVALLQARRFLLPTLPRSLGFTSCCMYLPSL